MNPNDLHKMKNEEINEEIPRLQNRLFELRSQAVTEKLENPRQLNQLRREIAQLKTEQRGRELATHQS